MNGLGTGSSGLTGQINFECSNDAYSCYYADIFCESGYTTRCDWECDGAYGCNTGNCHINGLCDVDFVRQPTITYDSTNDILYAICDTEDQCFNEVIDCNTYLTDYPNMKHCVIACTGEDACPGVNMICPNDQNLDCTVICDNYNYVCKTAIITANNGKNLIIVANSTYALQNASFVLDFFSFFFRFFLLFLLFFF